MDGAVLEKDFREEEYFGSVRLDESAVLQTGEDDIISMKNLHKTYLLGVEGVPALRGVSLTIKRGEFVCIFGTSGGGKTTMLNIIGTIDKPTKGEMNLCGHLINHKTDDLTLAMLRLKKIGFVFQTFNLLSSLTALENVEMPMVLAGELSADERKARAISLLTKVGMGGRLDHVPSQLSGGEQQRVTIARAMANKPEILLLDEPTGDLDTANTAIVMKLLTNLNKDEGITLVMVTHDVGLKMFSDRVVWMRDGKIQRIESITEASRHEAHHKLTEEIERIEKKKAGLLPRAAANTVMRNPEDYRPLSWRRPPSLSSSSSLPPPAQSHPSSSHSYPPPEPSHSTVFPNGTSDHPPPHQNGKKENGKHRRRDQEASEEELGEEGGRGNGKEMDAIIGSISDGINGIGLEEEPEHSLSRKKPAAAAPLLVDEEISLDDGR
jgi:putative ABC transport system ATP-binding protein